MRANEASRDQNVLTGKFLRIVVNPDGTTSIPPGNPFQGAGTARRALTGQTTPGNKCQETFAWGLHNLFRLAFDPNTAGTRLSINEVGQNLTEEIDLGQAGADYGWNHGGHPRQQHHRALQWSVAWDGAPDLRVRPWGPSPPPPGPAAPPSPAGPSCPTASGRRPTSAWICSPTTSAAGPSGLPGSMPFSTAADFATNLGGSSATSLIVCPFGSTQALYYATYAAGGQVRQISYALPRNSPPTAVASGKPLYGPQPLTVTFSAAGSSAPITGHPDLLSGASPMAASMSRPRA